MLIKDNFAVISPFSDLRKNIVLNKWKSNWSNGITNILNSYVFKLDKKILDLLNMPRVMLINLCVVENFPIPRLNLSTGMIAAYLRKQQYADVRIIDMQVGVSIDSIIKDCENYKPDLIGVSVSFGQKQLAFSLLEGLYNSNISNSLISVGNIIPSLYPNDFIEKFPRVIVSYQEGEVTVPELLDYIRGTKLIHEVQGVIYLDHDSEEIRKTNIIPIDMKELPTPALDTAEDISRLKGALTLETSRGCDYSKCTFCPRQHKLCEWRYLSAHQVITQLENLKRVSYELGIKPHIYLADEEFIGELPNGKEAQRVIEICNSIIDNKMGIKFDTSARADSVYDKKYSEEWNTEIVKMWKLCKDAGLDRLFIGVESGSQQQLYRYGKGTDIEQNIIAIRILSALGINIRLGFVMFDPLMKDFSDLINNIEFLGRTDAIMNKVELSNMTYEELYHKLVYDKEFVEANSAKQPIYTLVSYMLASLEVLVGSPYIKMLKLAEEREGKTLILNNGKPDSNMGRYSVRYLDDIIGKLSLTSQMWIDSNFGIMYTIKSLYKSEKTSAREILHNYMVRYREMCQYMLKYLIYIVKRDDSEFILDTDLKSYMEKVKFNEKEKAEGESLLNKDAIQKISIGVNQWQYIMLDMINDISSDLDNKRIIDTYDDRLKRTIQKWKENWHCWELINDYTD